MIRFWETGYLSEKLNHSNNYNHNHYFYISVQNKNRSDLLGRKLILPFAAGEGLKYRNHKTIFRLRSVRFDGIFSCSQIDYKRSRDLIFQAIDEIFWIFTLFTLAQLFTQKRRYFLYRWRKNSQILNTYLEHNKLGFTARLHML